jgi:hypothetical protein
VSGITNRKRIRIHCHVVRILFATQHQIAAMRRIMPGTYSSSSTLLDQLSAAILLD